MPAEATRSALITVKSVRIMQHPVTRAAEEDAILGGDGCIAFHQDTHSSLFPSAKRKWNDDESAPLSISGCFSRSQRFILEQATATAAKQHSCGDNLA